MVRGEILRYEEHKPYAGSFEFHLYIYHVLAHQIIQNDNNCLTRIIISYLLKLMVFSYLEFSRKCITLLVFRLYYSLALSYLSASLPYTF